MKIYKLKNFQMLITEQRKISYILGELCLLTLTTDTLDGVRSVNKNIQALKSTIAYNKLQGIEIYYRLLELSDSGLRFTKYLRESVFFRKIEELELDFAKGEL